MRFLRACRARAWGPIEWLLAADHLLIIGLLTVILLIFGVPDSPVYGLFANWTREMGLAWISPPGGVVALSLAGLVYPLLLRKPVYWFFHTVMVGGIVGNQWFITDNHKFLMAYWCLALGCILAVPPAHRRKVVTTNALALLGLCMAFATGWKALSPSFRDGGYFQSAFLTDHRFQYVACLGGGMSVGKLAENRDQQRALIFGHTDGNSISQVQLSNAPRLRVLAQASAWWTILVEGSLAVLCLWPLIRGDHPMIARWRNGLLLVFLCTTYAAANVVGYGLTLAVLGFAQAPAESRKLRAGYLGAFVLIPLYTLPNTPTIRALIL